MDFLLGSNPTRGQQPVPQKIAAAEDHSAWFGERLLQLGPRRLVRDSKGAQCYAWWLLVVRCAGHSGSSSFVAAGHAQCRAEHHPASKQLAVYVT
ncbi:hypothetical protein GUJ93_ZPchr0011g28309 [Zizania palustris]|uniref:Uncharacterized protein n=1 Tax=Zizania palustris TaxID=103762 RepID=A0A8J5WIS9_ZIZPA|nr:hypothetical protein GUJ93_ZPchr0011g28309 [Zizania palustris]